MQLWKWWSLWKPLETRAAVESLLNEPLLRGVVQKFLPQKKCEEKSNVFSSPFSFFNNRCRGYRLFYKGIRKKNKVFQVYQFTRSCHVFHGKFWIRNSNKNLKTWPFPMQTFSGRSILKEWRLWERKLKACQRLRETKNYLFPRFKEAQNKKQCWNFTCRCNITG